MQNRVIRYPSGRENAFDIVGHPKNEYGFCVIFTWHSGARAVTLLREFAQAAPPHGARHLCLPCGGLDRSKHASFLDDMAERARELSDDPLHSFLIFLKLYAEAMEDIPDSHPGCFVATVTFQDQSFDREMRRLTVDSVIDWRERFVGWLEEIAAVYPPRGKLAMVDLADSILAFTYGGMTLAKALDDNSAISRQAMMFRETVRLYFQPD